MIWGYPYFRKHPFVDSFTVLLVELRGEPGNCRQFGRCIRELTPVVRSPVGNGGAIWESKLPEVRQSMEIQ